MQLLIVMQVILIRDKNMSKIDPYVAKILKEHLPEDVNKEDAVWLHKQSGQWIAKHKTLVY